MKLLIIEVPDDYRGELLCQSGKHFLGDTNNRLFQTHEAPTVEELGRVALAADDCYESDPAVFRKIGEAILAALVSKKIKQKDKKQNDSIS